MIKIYKEGDKVEIVEYGSAMWFNKHSGSPSLADIMADGKPILSENANVIWYDMNPELVGKTGTIDKVWETVVDDEIRAKYSIKPDWTAKEAITKTSWYAHLQLKLVCDHRWSEREGQFYCTKCKEGQPQKQEEL